jgi:predicted transcriptional regulator of viral defense system
MYICTMSTNKQTKINLLLQSQPYGVVFLSSWLQANGYSRELQNRYIQSGWFRRIGRGALIRTGQKITWTGALYSLQSQAQLKIHIGGRSALNLLGMAQYLEVNAQTVELFGQRGSQLPAWFTGYDWAMKFILHKTTLLPFEMGLREYNIDSYSIRISGPARALLECLFLAPRLFSLTEAYQIMEGMTALHPKEVQSVLEKCNSVKAVRLFLYMANKARHTWAKRLDLSKIDLGSGKRSIVKDGIYISEFQITIPAELAAL